jgi:transglutaminase-like putative cysteine protease
MPISPNQLKRRIQSRWRNIFSPGDIYAMLIVSILLIMPALALNVAGWALGMRTIIPITLLSVAFGFLLSRSQYNELVALIVSAMYGFGIVVIVTAMNQPTEFFPSVADVFIRTMRWTIDAFSGGINQDALVFTILVATLFWFLGYNAVWHIFRLDRVWRVILPPGLILLTNMVVYTGDEPLDLYLIIFLLMSLLLIVRSNLDARQWDWYINGIRVPSVVRRQFSMVGVALSIMALVFAWGMPTGDLQDRLNNFQQFLASDPIQQMSEIWNRLFAPIESEGPATTDYYGGDLLNLGGAISLGDEVVLFAEAPNVGSRYYWRSRVFERYANGQWSPSASLRVTDQSAPIEIPMNQEVIGQRREPVNQKMTIGMTNSRIFYTIPQPTSIDGTGRIDLTYSDDPDNTSMNISVVRPLKVLPRGTIYNATGMISVATADELRTASTVYPEWVTNPNLFVGQPSGRVLSLAQQIVNDMGATNPYDKAKAIERWLRINIKYNESISAPPPNVDPVEWVLFDAREGYCTYYATSMIVMLRGLGIPARMSAGFSQGDYNSATGQYIIRERDAHTWVEVYFPGYGWIEFEPTAAEEPLNRDGDDLAEPEPQSSSPLPSPTPSATPTLVPSPTPQSTQEALQQNQPQPTLTPTSQPTFTATPVIVPTVQPPIAPQDAAAPSFLITVFVTALIIMLLIVIIALAIAFLFWWWEWRGMVGLSPVSRAYARMERYIGLLGIRFGDNKTTLEKRRELQKRLPAAKEPIRAISELYTVERYRGRSDDPTEHARFAETADKAWDHTRKNIVLRWLRRFIPFISND